MRIRELVENVQDKNHNGIDDQLEYDLADDLLFFMNNDDDTYRRHTYPVLFKAKSAYDKGMKVNRSLFSDAVSNAYSGYCKKFPRRELPESLPKEINTQVCNSLYDECKKKVKKD